MARVRYIYFKRTWKENKNQALVIPNGYFSPWTVYSFFWGMDPSFNYQKWQRPKLRACRQHFFLSSSWFINQEKDKKQSMRETWVQSYFSPLHCLSSSLILKRVESGVVYSFQKYQNFSSWHWLSWIFFWEIRHPWGRLANLLYKHSQFRTTH